MELKHDIVDGIYAAALDAQRWPDVARDIGLAVSARSMALMLADENLVSRNLTLTSGVLDQQPVRDAYRDYFGAIDPAVELFANMPIGQATTTTMVWPARTIACNEFYNDFYSRLTLRDSMCAPLLRKEGCTAFLAAHRDKDTPLFDTADVALFGRYMTHMRKALLVHREIVHLRRRADTLEALFDRMTLGVVLSDGHGRIRYANRAAQGVLRRGDGLAESDGTLVALDRATAPRLAQMVAAAACDGRGGGTLGVPRASTGDSYAVLAVPHRCLPNQTDAFDLATTQGAVQAGGENLVLILIRDSNDNGRSSFAMVRRQFALTGSETDLLEALTFGETMTEYCARRGIALTTGKFHLRGLFAKTATHRQSDLVRTALNLVGSFAPFPHH